ncbi:4Fe-4S binding protein [Marinigracilibium pacificum]|uniref:4Fe-4S binding protein n=1 Tax=Marinigracilibium pacificum TaxID=2729599 RepID=A0A848J2F7_9BACT|nr:4Fe-4S dicluster domain-containing protein [Marinigracilibium pacificum]NMM49508.1 4Fe-4S binding protein [Marinigracilibium pacificum]
MNLIQKTGITIFCLALTMFIGLLFTSSFTLTPEIAKEVITDESHFESLSEGLKPLYNQELSKTEFISGVNEVVESTNEHYRKQELWDNVIYTDYTFSLTRESLRGPVESNNPFLLFLILGAAIIGSLLYISQKWKDEPAGIKNNNVMFRSMTRRGALGIITAIFLILFYIFLYKLPAYIIEWVRLFDPVSMFIKGQPASQWFMYGFLYTVAIVIMGIRMFKKYRHSNYQILRNTSVMFFQISFAFLIPEVLYLLNLPAVDLKNIWPLDYTFFFEYRINEYIESGTIGIWMMVWGILLIIIGVPLFTFFFGKRWYCSWVCGCGGLAETLGDPYRHLSDKSIKAWKIERYSVHLVLVFAIVMTGAVMYTYFSGNSNILGVSSYDIRSWYGFGIGFIFAGAVGTGFYPIMGNRVWCRFGCPLAAYLGIVQRFKSRFRITTNGGQCISCGNCSTYCEMGIDVRWYAQRGQNIVRASCVGCGVCSAVCPRGVLNLEVKNEKGRFGKDLLTGNNNTL